MLKIHFTCILTLSVVLALGQDQDPISLDSCFSWGESNYPEIVKYDLLKRSNEFNLQNVNKRKLPQLSVIGQATYQSDVTSFPGGEALGAPEISKDQYNLYGEVVQPLSDLAVINQQKRILESQGEIDQISVEVSLYHVKERISDIYFGILLTRSQLNQSRLAIDDIRTGIQTTQSHVANGTALQSTVNVLQAELLGIEQRVLELESIHRSYLEMLSSFIDRELDTNTILLEPTIQPASQEIRRSELRLFNSQLHAIELQNELIRKNNQPKFSLFFRGGIGRPALNFLSNDFEPYYIGGLRLAWNVSNLYTAQGQQQINSINQGIVRSNKETFLFNTNLTMSRQTNEIEKMKEMIDKDHEIVKLREDIMQTSKGQLDNGVITANDYKTAVSELDLARQKLSMHEVEMLMLQNKYRLTRGIQ